MRRGVASGGAALLVVAGLWLALRAFGPAPPAPPSDEPAGPGPSPASLPAPAPDEPAPPVAPAPGPSGLSATAADPPRREYEPGSEDMAAFLRASLEAHLPDRKLSSDEIERAAEALLRLRRARLELRELQPTAENAERLRALREELGRASDDFEYVLEMSPAEFTARVQPGIGVDTGASGPPEPDPTSPVTLDQLPAPGGGRE